MTSTERPSYVNQVQLGQLLGGIIGVQVSRLRTGQSHPGVATMVHLRELFGWSVDDQADCIVADQRHGSTRYAEGFRQRYNAWVPSADVIRQLDGEEPTATPR